MVDSLRKNLDVYIVIGVSVLVGLLAYHAWLKANGVAGGISEFPRLK